MESPTFPGRFRFVFLVESGEGAIFTIWKRSRCGWLAFDEPSRWDSNWWSWGSAELHREHTAVAADNTIENQLTQQDLGHQLAIAGYHQEMKYGSGQGDEEWMTSSSQPTGFTRATIPAR